MMNHSSEPIGSLGNFLNFKWRVITIKTVLHIRSFNYWMGSAVSCRLTRPSGTIDRLMVTRLYFLFFLPRLV